jgi:drug/metabolite transporter (DMT)-like permease
MPEQLSIHPQPRRLQADLVLLSVAIIWGSAFVVQRIVARSSSVFLFNGLRFLLAGLVLLPFLWIGQRKRSAALRSNHPTWPGIVLAGLLLTAGAAFQQAGLRYTTAGNAGFITGLYVVLIPLILAVILKQSVRPTIWLAAFLATLGLFLLSTGGQLQFKIGDLLELAGTIFWALHVIWIGHLVSLMGGLQIAVGQYFVCGLASIGLGLLIEPAQAQGVLGAGWAILYTGIVSVGLGYTMQIYGQKVAPPADAAILLSMEAVFAALFGWLFLSEALNAIQLIGCGVMLAGMLLAQAGVITDLSRVHL